jgi:hypothetical protein
MAKAKTKAKGKKKIEQQEGVGAGGCDNQSMNLRNERERADAKEKVKLGQKEVDKFLDGLGVMSMQAMTTAECEAASDKPPQQNVAPKGQELTKQNMKVYTYVYLENGEVWRFPTKVLLDKLTEMETDQEMYFGEAVKFVKWNDIKNKGSAVAYARHPDYQEMFLTARIAFEAIK